MVGLIYRIFTLRFKEPLTKDNEERLISYFQSIRKALKEEINKMVKSAKNTEVLEKIPILGSIYKTTNLATRVKITELTLTIDSYMKMDKVDSLTYRFGYPHDLSKVNIGIIKKGNLIFEDAMEKELKVKFPGILIEKAII